MKEFCVEEYEKWLKYDIEPSVEGIRQAYEDIVNEDFLFKNEMNKYLLQIAARAILEKHIGILKKLVLKLQGASMLTRWYWAFRMKRALKKMKKACEECLKFKEELENI